MTGTPQERADTASSQPETKKEPHELTPVFSSLDPDHPFYMECSCGDLFRVDLTSRRAAKKGRRG